MRVPRNHAGCVEVEALPGRGCTIGELLGQCGEQFQLRGTEHRAESELARRSGMPAANNASASFDVSPVSRVR